ncbi:MAG: DUF4202 domain-containing protein [Gammaproteobacteria bacterium]|nr:DUF4202 domain-containing protein [Gammaproteobacteria bacterium]
MSQLKSSEQLFTKAIKLIDKANNEDPNKVTVDGKIWPKELLYSHRMSNMLVRYKSDADDVMKISVRAQHIQRWKSDRKEYPMNRKGYHQWRTSLYTFHADTVGLLLEEAGYDGEFISRVKCAVAKKSIRTNEDTMLVEDVAALVFIEYYMLPFVERHPDYTEEKWINIIQKTWRKMTEQAHQFALSGSVSLPESLVPLIQKSVAD